MVVTGKKRGEVTFVCNTVDHVGKVYLVGDFNNWDPTHRKMTRAKDGSFRSRMRLNPGEYGYKFVADGVWVADGSGDAQVPNCYGTFNSVVRVS